ncbi:MAG: transketolase [Elusimicrobia bacterium]|nr:transketolase [Elusimicrobiota bacterium]
MQSPSLSHKDVSFLEGRAYDLRRKLLLLTGKIGGAHIGGSFSMMDILVVLYHRFLRVDPQNPRDPERDIFVLSKGHGAVGYCLVLADMGFFPEKDLDQFNQTGSRFGVHPDRHKIPGVDASTGSLGHGLSLSVGYALAKRHLKRQQRVFCLISDGELCEGSTWEAFLAGAHFKLGNLYVIVDFNKMTQDGSLAETMNMEPVRKKLESFNWSVREIDGHNINQIVEILENLPEPKENTPTVILAHTVKGKGVPWMENTSVWHYGGLDEEKEKQALADLAHYYGRNGK